MLYLILLSQHLYTSDIWSTVWIHTTVLLFIRSAVRKSAGRLSYSSFLMFISLSLSLSFPSHISADSSVNVMFSLPVSRQLSVWIVATLLHFIHLQFITSASRSEFTRSCCFLIIHISASSHQLQQQRPDSTGGNSAHYNPHKYMMHDTIHILSILLTKRNEVSPDWTASVQSPISQTCFIFVICCCVKSTNQPNTLQTTLNWWAGTTSGGQTDQ